MDLGRDYYVSELAITNRGDCCGDRLSNFEIKVGEIKKIITNPLTNNLLNIKIECKNLLY